MQTGAVKCWGANSQGQLGYGHVNDVGGQLNDMPPPNVDVGPGVVAKVVAGTSFTCVLMESGVVRCWGRNAQGQLGYGHVNNIGDGPNEMPPPDVDVGGIVSDLTANASTCALMDNNEVRCWGADTFGALGYGLQSHLGDGPNEMPTPALELPDGIISFLKTGSLGFHNCIVIDNTRLACWGQNNTGQLGYGTNTHLADEPNEMPPPFVF
jgi:alpha-tubulin suppressor-like RCC1 family protein